MIMTHWFAYKMFFPKKRWVAKIAILVILLISIASLFTYNFLSYAFPARKIPNFEYSNMVTSTGNSVVWVGIDDSSIDKSKINEKMFLFSLDKDDNLEYIELVTHSAKRHLDQSKDMHLELVGFYPGKSSNNDERASESMFVAFKITQVEEYLFLLFIDERRFRIGRSSYIDIAVVKAPDRYSFDKADIKHIMTNVQVNTNYISISYYHIGASLKINNTPVALTNLRLSDSTRYSLYVGPLMNSSVILNDQLPINTKPIVNLIENKDSNNRLINNVISENYADLNGIHLDELIYINHPYLAKIQDLQIEEWSDLDNIPTFHLQVDFREDTEYSEVDYMRIDLDSGVIDLWDIADQTWANARFFFKLRYNEPIFVTIGQKSSNYRLQPLFFLKLDLR